MSRCAVIGAGIVGSCIAYELATRGHEVLLIERDAPGQACSSGNAGAISEFSVVPLAMPGVLRNAAQMLLDAESPLYVPASYVPRAAQWLMRFVRSAKPDVVAANATRLATLNADAGRRHAALAQRIDAADLIAGNGHLYVYPDEAALRKDAQSWALREAHGCRPQRLDRAGILALEPNVGPRYTVGMYLAGQRVVVNPQRYVERIVQALMRSGGTLLRERALGVRAAAGGWRVSTSVAARDAEHVIVAAGAWANALLAPLGAPIALESQRGYHAQFQRTPPISRVVVLADRKAFVAPMEQGLRIAGTVEFGGLRREPDMRRAQLLERFARESFSGLDGARATHWMGHRPCMPDSLPCIGPVPGHPRLWMATGHGHLGMTQAPMTAQLVADAIANAR